MSYKESHPLSYLSDLVNCVNGDVKWVHFFAVGPNFSTLHKDADSIYKDLNKAYDTLVELCFQIRSPIGHPNTSASRIGYEGSKEGALTALEGYKILYKIIDHLLKETVDVLNCFQENDCSSNVATRAYLEELIQDLSLENNYKNVRRASQQ